MVSGYVMRINEIEEFRYPRRKPWLLIVVLVVIAVFVWRRYAVSPAPEAETAAEDVAEELQPAADDRPARRLPPVSGDVKALLSDARRFEAGGDFLEARKRYLAVLDQVSDGRGRWEAEKALGSINVELVASVRPMAEKVDVIVKRGDSLQRIARRLGTTVDLIQVANGISNANLIKAGDHLRVFKGRFALTASKTRNDLLVTMNGKFFKRYGIGTGRHGKTPVGQFKVTEKIKEPVWWRPDGKEIPFGDPQNILGTRWMTIRALEGTPDVRGYGIHGTWDEASIGKAESAGCLRMRNRDVEELYMFIPVGTRVTLVE